MVYGSDYFNEETPCNSSTCGQETDADMGTENGFPMTVIVTGFFVTSLAYLICFCCCIVQFFIRRGRQAQIAQLNTQTPSTPGIQKNDTLKRKLIAQFKEGLKTFTKPGNQGNGSNDDVDCSESCPICFDEYTGNHQEIFIGYIKKCGHYFHFDCIWKWLENRGSCPLCREKVRLTEQDIRGLALCHVPLQLKKLQTSEFGDVAKTKSHDNTSLCDVTVVPMVTEPEDCSSVSIAMPGPSESDSVKVDTSSGDDSNRHSIGFTNQAFDITNENISPMECTSSSASVFVNSGSGQPEV